MINRVVLVGRLTRDPDLRYTNSGTSVASFTVAVDRNFTNQQGNREADFINCVVWGKSAENFANFTHKGSLVGIEGRILVNRVSLRSAEILTELLPTIRAVISKITPMATGITMPCRIRLPATAPRRIFQKTTCHSN